MSNTKMSRSAVVFIAILLAVFAFPCFGESEKAGDAIPQDGEASRDAAEKLLRQGDAAMEAKDYKTALKCYVSVAEQGNAEAQFKLGDCYERGAGVKQDSAEAVKWFRKAAEQGNAEAQTRLGTCYKTGRGVNNDYGEAVKWYRKAAENGYEAAQRELAEFDFTYFWPVNRQDFEEAVKWRRKAAEQGNPKAMGLLGWHYATGRGVKQDYKTAVEWFRKGAELNNAESQFGMGESIKNSWLARYEMQKKYSELGIIVDTIPRYDEEKDWKTVVEWYAKAADNGLLDVDLLKDIRGPIRKRIESDPGYAEWLRLHQPMFAIPGEGITLPCQIANMYQKQYDKLKESSDSADAEVAKQYLAESVKWLRKAAEMGDGDGLYQLVSLASNGNKEAGEVIHALAKDEKPPYWVRVKAEDYVEGYSRSGEWRLGSELEDPDDWFGEELDEEDENAGEETKQQAALKRLGAE